LHTTGQSPPPVDEYISSAIQVLGAIPPCVSGQAVQLTDQFLVGADFGRSKYFAGVDLRGAKLWKAYMGWSNFDGAQFDGADMTDRASYGGTDEAWRGATKAKEWSYLKYNFIVNFESSTLRGATFRNTSVEGASFTNADLYDADFSNTRLGRADFSGAKHRESMVLTDACYDPPEPPIGLDQSMLDAIRSKRKDCSPLPAETPSTAAR
jgi:uncharacterized protein YjbI with pentapeptide repeats